MGRPNSILRTSACRGAQVRKISACHGGSWMTLVDLQRQMAGGIMVPLTRAYAGNPARAKAEALLKPNGRLTSRERLDIYRRSYWCRVLDSLREDFPGLCVVLGRRGFDRL